MPRPSNLPRLEDTFQGINADAIIVNCDLEHAIQLGRTKRVTQFWLDEQRGSSSQSAGAATFQPVFGPS